MKALHTKTVQCTATIDTCNKPQVPWGLLSMQQRS